MYPSYLVHVNNNHNPKTGQFAPGDGDGDGVSNDHANRKKGLTKGEKVAIGVGALTISAAAAGSILSIARMCHNPVNDLIDDPGDPKEFVKSISFDPLERATYHASGDISSAVRDAVEDAGYTSSLQKQLGYNESIIKDRYSF